MKTEIIKKLGTSKNGFHFYLGADAYVYQQFPTDKSYWVNNENVQGKFNGWFCSYPAWQRTMHKIID